MSESKRLSMSMQAFIAVAIFGALVVGTWWFLDQRGTWPRGEALGTALGEVIKGSEHDQSLVAGVILDNYRETRSNASRWSGIYWGFTFFAAVFSAVAALVLKVETIIKNEAAKKDIAALLSVTAALLVTVSTSGDFQRKWQANRIAAAELEFTGYQFLEHNGAEPRSYLAAVGQTLLRRQLAIAGSAEKQGKPPPATDGSKSQ